MVSGISQLMFGAAVATLPGSKLLHRHDCEKLRAAYQAFEGLFELAASPVPHAFVPRFRAACRQLLSAFRWVCSAALCILLHSSYMAMHWTTGPANPLPC